MATSERVRLKGRTRLLLNLGGALLVAAMVPLFWGNALDNAVSDLFFRIRGPLPEQHDIVVVGIDDHSFANLQLQWPWPRSLHARLIDSLSSARVIVFDVLFDTKDRGGDDKLFSQAIADHPGVILSTARIIKEDEKYTTEFWLDPIPPLREATPYVGFIDLPVDADGVVRRARRQIGGRASLGYLAAKEYAGGDFESSNDEFAINFMGPSGTVETISYYEALEWSKIPVPDPFRDKLVFIGTTSEIGNDPNRPDRFRTPFSRAGATMPGVEIHANVAFNLLAHTAVHQVPQTIARPLGVALAFLCGVLFFRLQITRSALFFVLVVTILSISAYLLFSGASLYTQLASFMVPVVAVFLASLMVHYYELFKSEKRIREILADQPRVIHESEARPIKVFLSYSHKPRDTSYMAEILDFVKGLNTEGIAFWIDKNIVKGDSWEQEIMKRLAESDMALTLVSQPYLDSEYCNQEVKALLERSAVIIPVMLSPCEWKRHSWLSERQFIPGGGETIAEHYQDPGKRERVYLDIRDALRTQAERLRNAQA